MEELSKINRVVDREFPEADRKNLIVLDATTGQKHDMDIPVYFVGVGEGIDDLLGIRCGKLR